MPEPLSRTTEVTIIANADAMAGYARAIGFGLDDPGAERMTHFSAMLWLSTPAIRELITDACPAGTLPMQTSQSITMADDFAAGESLTVSASIKTHDHGVTLSYRVAGQDGVARTAGEIGFICISQAERDRILQ